MKNIKSGLVLLSICLLPGAVWAQAPVVPRQDVSTSPYQRYTTYQVTLRYGVLQPLSGLNNYIDAPGIRNYSLAGEWVLPGNFSFGAQFSDNYFQKRLPRQVYETTNGSKISAVQTRTLSVQSLQAMGKYHFADVTSIVRPYVQLGAGVALTDYTYYLGSLEGERSSRFTFAGQAALGSRFLFGRESRFGADVQLNYQYIPFSFNIPFSSNQIPNVATAGAWVGVFYRWW